MSSVCVCAYFCLLLNYVKTTELIELNFDCISNLYCNSSFDCWLRFKPVVIKILHTSSPFFYFFEQNKWENYNTLKAILINKCFYNLKYCIRKNNDWKLYILWQIQFIIFMEMRKIQKKINN